MTRLLGAILLLCAQVFAVLGTGNLVVCTQEGGATAVEVIGAECCREARAAEERGRSADAVAAEVTGSDRCSDVPWTQDQAPVARGPVVRSAPDTDLRSPPPAIVALTDLPACAAAAALCGPWRARTREPVPRSARTLVLRC